VIPGEGAIGDIFHFVSGKYALHQRAYRVSFRDDDLLPKFGYYCFVAGFKAFITAKAVSATVSSIRKPMIEKFRIPVPPLEVQREIVRILDQFVELQSELQAERDARLTQFTHYRDALMTFADREEVLRIPLGDLCEIVDGTHQTPRYVDDGVPFVSVENIDSLSATKKYITPEDFQTGYKLKPRANDLLMTRIGTIGACAVVESDDPLAYYVTLALIRPKSPDVSAKFLKHFIQSRVGRSELSKRTLHTAVPIKINLGDIGKVLIPVPSGEDQQRIVETLDKFDALVNDSSIGLPAEINARRRQYDYYRDRLLAFEEVAA